MLKVKNIWKHTSITRFMGFSIIFDTLRSLWAGIVANILSSHRKWECDDINDYYRPSPLRMKTITIWGQWKVIQFSLERAWETIILGKMAVSKCTTQWLLYIYKTVKHIRTILYWLDYQSIAIIKWWSLVARNFCSFFDEKKIK